MNKFLTTREFAKLANVSVATVLRWIKEGIVNAHEARRLTRKLYLIEIIELEKVSWRVPLKDKRDR